jgi:phosphate uptake regulator
MNSPLHIQRVLRVHLLALARLSQQAVDHSIKGYEFRNPDFCRYVCTPDISSPHDCRIKKRAAEHHRRIKDLCRRLIVDGLTSQSDFLYASAALEIAAALHLATTAAVQIAKDTLHLLESSPQHTCAALLRVGRLVNGAMRVAVVALFNEDAGHAFTVLQNQELTRLCAPGFDGLYGGVDQKILAEGAVELAIARSLGEIGRQARDIAETMLCWLEQSRLSEPAATVQGQSSSASMAAREDKAIEPTCMRSPSYC